MKTVVTANLHGVTVNYLSNLLSDVVQFLRFRLLVPCLLLLIVLTMVSSAKYVYSPCLLNVLLIFRFSKEQILEDNLQAMTDKYLLLEQSLSKCSSSFFLSVFCYSRFFFK